MAGSCHERALAVTPSIIDSEGRYHFGACLMHSHRKGIRQKMNNVLLVGQLPPPVNGQTVMIKEFLEGSYERIRLHPVPMSFSRTIDEVGRFKLRKLTLLFSTWLDIVVGRCRSRANILYYPPCG